METGVPTETGLIDSDTSATKDGIKTVSKRIFSTAVVCVAQIVVAVVFIIASLYNLTFHPNDYREFWISLLWLNAGYLVPTPKFKSGHQPSSAP